MPRVSYFNGILILMFGNEGHHAIGHFHARYAEHRASIGFDGQILAGSLPQAQLRLARRWAAMHEPELIANWERLRRGERVEPIDPLA